MLYFTLGRSGSGKTTWIRKLMADFAKSGRYKANLIIPEQFSFETEKAMLSLLGAKDFDNINILSFTRLAENLLEDFFHGNPNYLSEGAKALLMNMAIDALQDKLSIYNHRSSNTALVNDLLLINEELKQSALKPEDLAKASSDLPNGVLKLKCGDFSNILLLYQTLLDERYFDESEILKTLCDLLKENDIFSEHVFAFDAFRGFTKAEYEVIEQIIIQAKAVYFTFSADSLDFDEMAINVFSHTSYTIQKLKEIAKRNDIKIAKPQNLSGHSKYNNFPSRPRHFESKDLFALEYMFYSQSSGVYSQPAPNIHVYTGLNKYDECDFVALMAKKLIREKGYRCREIAVIERSSGSYRPELVSAFQKYGLPVFEDTRHNISTEPLIAYIMSALEICVNGFKTETMLRYLKSGICPFKSEDIAKVENYVFVWQIEGAKWKDEWTFHPEGYGLEFKPKHKFELEKINEVKEKILEPLLKLKTKLDKSDIKEICRSLYDFLIENNAVKSLKIIAKNLDLYGQNAASQNSTQVWDTLMSIFDTLVQTLGDEPVSAFRFLELFKLIVSLTDIGSIPHGLDEITIGTADRIRISAPKAVFLVGTYTDGFPLSHGEQLVFSNRERSKLRDFGFELSSTSEEKAIEEQHITYNMLSLAKEKLYVSYPLSSIDGETYTPSQIPEFILSRFPHCTRILPEDIDSFMKIESLDSGFEISAELFCDDSPLSLALKTYFKDKVEYKDKIDALSRLAKGEDFKIHSKETAVNLFNKDIKISASGVEKFYSCPFSYFCRYGLNAKSRKIAKIDSLQNGLIMHFVFEYLLSEYELENIKSMSKSEQKKLINIAIDIYVDEKLGGKDSLNNRILFKLKSFANTAVIILERILFEFDASKFKIADVELEIGEDSKIPAYTLKLSDGGSLTLSGAIDRLDLLKDGENTYFRIIDYKTGGKAFKLTEVLEGLNMQMLIYLMSVWHGGKKAYGDLTPAAVLYVPAKLGIFDLPRQSTDEEVLNKKISLGKMDGILLKDENIIKSMEPDIKGKIIPVKKRASGSLAGNCVSIEVFGILNRMVDEKLIEMAEKLHSGKIAAIPIKNDADFSYCDFCEYMSICGHESTDDFNMIPKRDNSAIISNLEKQVEKDDDLDI